jgi:hypothetical protein
MSQQQVSCPNLHLAVENNSVRTDSIGTQRQLSGKFHLISNCKMMPDGTAKTSGLDRLQTAKVSQAASLMKSHLFSSNK